MQFLTNIVIGVLGEDMGQDPVALAQQLLPMLANFSGTSIDTSKLYYETTWKQQDGNKVSVRAAGNIISIIDNKPAAIRFSQNYEVVKVGEAWKLCQSINF